MAEHIFNLLRSYLDQYGYWTVAAALLLENAGLPVPGETVLLVASFLAYSERQLQLSHIILVGICAAVVGDNLGFLIGQRGGRPLLERYRKALWISSATIARGERLFEHYGATAILFARFIAGMRIVAGPLAGALRMDWRKFLVFNLLGAILWVTVISFVGYFFGEQWEELPRIIRGAHFAIFGVACLVIALLWWRKRRMRLSQRDQHD